MADQLSAAFSTTPDRAAQCGPWGREPAELPVSGNRAGLDGSPRTVVSYLDAAEGHFAIYNEGRLRVLAGQFWVSALDGVPTLQE